VGLCVAAPRVARRAKRGVPGRTRTYNQTVTSGGITTSFVESADFVFEADRVRCAAAGSFLVRNWCSDACSCRRAGLTSARPMTAQDIDEAAAYYVSQPPKRDIIGRTKDAHAADNISEADLLREVMNTVGSGQLGASIRCVVSVSIDRGMARQYGQPCAGHSRLWDAIAL
jgi:hypothetical protein